MMRLNRRNRLRENI